MAADLRYCAQLVQHFEQYSNWPMIGDDGRLQLVKHLAATARDDHEAHAAVTALLGDAARASNQATNKVPTMGELTQWLVAQRADQYDTPAPASAKTGCGRIIDAWTHPDGNPSRCENGWIRRRIWREVRGMVDENGGPLYQPYDHSGRCRCQDGGWL